MEFSPDYLEFFHIIFHFTKAGTMYKQSVGNTETFWNSAGVHNDFLPLVDMNNVWCS